MKHMTGKMLGAINAMDHPTPVERQTEDPVGRLQRAA